MRVISFILTKKMAKNINEYVISKVIEHLDTENKLMHEMFNILKRYPPNACPHGLCDHEPDDIIYVDSCQICNRYCIDNRESLDSWSNSSRCTECHELICYDCETKKKSVLYFHCYDFESQLPDILCQIGANCLICNDETDKSWLEIVCQKCYPTRLDKINDDKLLNK